MLMIDPALFPDVQGSTDSEVVFHLALTFGLEGDPIGALEQTLGTIEAMARRHGLEPAIQASIGVSDGRSLWAVRYASAEVPRSLFVSADAETVKHLAGGDARLQRLHDGDRLDRLRALQRPARRLARDRALVGAHRAAGRRARAPAVPAGRRRDRLTARRLSVARRSSAATWSARGDPRPVARS